MNYNGSIPSRHDHPFLYYLTVLPVYICVEVKIEQDLQ